VVGRTTRLGERYSFDVRLRSGLSGAVVATYVAELPVAEPLDPVVDGLAGRIAQSMLALEESGGLAVSAAPPVPREVVAPPPVPVREADGQGAPFGLWDFDSDEPLSIRADELDATDSEGARTLRFRSNVEVEQGDLLLFADRLEAFYESGAKEPHRLTALRSIRAAFLNEMKKDGSESLDEEVCITLLRKLEKQHKESIEAFDGAGREEQAATERAELAVIQGFLPQLADEDQTRTWVATAIAETGASQPGDVGRVMGAVMKAHKGDVDGALARRLAAELLAD